MALTDATRLANFSSGVGTDGTLDTNNLSISGVATAATLGVSGVSTAASSVIAGIITANSTGIDAGAGIITATTVSATTGSFSGTVTANAFSGDGSELTGVSGFATALSSDQTSPLNVFFKTPKQVNIGTGVSISVESDTTSGNVAFLRENIIHVGSGSTFHVGSDTTLLMNVLSIF